MMPKEWYFLTGLGMGMAWWPLMRLFAWMGRRQAEKEIEEDRQKRIKARSARPEGGT